MAGWYCLDSDESVHSGHDMCASDVAIQFLKYKVEQKAKILSLEAEIERLKALIKPRKIPVYDMDNLPDLRIHNAKPHSEFA